MRYIVSWVLLCAIAHAGAVPPATETPPTTTNHTLYRPFWTHGTIFGFGILGSLFAADAITTQIGLDNGFKEMDPLMRPFTSRGPAGEAAGFALGFGAELGVTYLLHRSHRYKAERIAFRLMVVGEGAGVGNNIARVSSADKW